MAYAVGIGLAGVVWGFARVVGFDRDRSFYPTVLVVVAWYYVLFAVMGGSTRALALESVGMLVFMLLAVVGFNVDPWLVAAGLAAHGIFDFFHAGLVTNPGVPQWWPAFCMSIDIGLAVAVASSRQRLAPATRSRSAG